MKYIYTRNLLAQSRAMARGGGFRVPKADNPLRTMAEDKSHRPFLLLALSAKEAQP